MKQFCTNCGAVLEPDMKFCSSCGQPISSSELDNTPPEHTHDEQPMSTEALGDESVPAERPEEVEDTTPTALGDAPPPSIPVDPPISEQAPPIIEQHQAEQPSTPPPVPPIPPQQSTPKKPMSKGAKIGIGITVALAAVMIVAHFIVQSMLDPMKKIDQVVAAYEAKDEAMFNHLTVKQGIIYEPQSFFQYYDSQNFTSKELKRELLQALSMTNNDFYATVNDSNGETFGYIEPKKWFIYDTIDIVPNSYAWQANTDFPSLKLDVYGEEYTLTDELKTIGTFLVGQYEVTVQADDIPFGEKEMSYPITITPSGEWEENFSSEQFGIVLQTNIQHELDPGTLTLLVNGEKSDISWKSLDQLLTIPFFKSDQPVKLQLELEREGETIQSAEVTVDGENPHFVDVSFDSALLQKVFPARFTVQEAEQFITNFREDFETGLNFSNASYILEYFPPSSKIQQEYAKFVNGTAPSAVYNFYRFDTSLLSQTDTTFVFTSVEAFDFYDGKTTKYNRTKEYTVQIIDGQLYITDISIKQTNRS